MITQADLKRYRALQQKKFRSESGLFLVQGRKVVEEVLSSKFHVERLLASEEAAEFIGERAAAKKVPVQILAGHELDRIGTLEKGNELIAITAIPPEPASAKPGAGDLILALDGIHDPRNMGGLLRIADWFGVAQVLCSKDCMEIWNPKCVQSTMGSLFRVPVRYVDLPTALGTLRAAGASLYAADMNGKPVFDVKLARPAVLVLGSESHGLSESVSEAAGMTVLSIPRVGHAESLNVAMAASALCTEFTRQAVPPSR
jgi:TrmH family RNA methyltransferase